MGKAKKIKIGLFETLMIIFAVIFIIPALVVIMNAFKPLGKILSDTFGLPDSLYLDNFVYVLDNMNYFHIFKNTVLICVFAITGTVILSAMCAYRLSRWNNKLSKI